MKDVVYKTPIEGVVSDKFYLYVRNSPNEKSSAVCILESLTRVLIDPDFEDPSFYKIIIPGLLHSENRRKYNFDQYYHGYCMKRYISIKKEG